MTVEPASAAGTSEHLGKTSYFCSTSCKQKFDADPAKYLAASKDKAMDDHGGCGGSTTVSSAKTSRPDVGNYICPMHPEVRSDKAGDCPKCGTTLVAK